MKAHSRINTHNMAEEANKVNTPKFVLGALCTLFAAATLSLGWGAQTTFAQGEPPPQFTPQAAEPTAKPAVRRVARPTTVPASADPNAVPGAVVPAGSLRVKIIACIDVNRDKICLPDEARVPGVAISIGDQVFATGNTGETDVVIPANSQIEFTPPDGYKDADNNYRKQLLSAGRLDLPLILGFAGAPTVAPAAAPVPGIEVKLPENFMQPIVNIDVDLRPVYIGLAAIGGIILLGYLLLGGSLRGIKHVYQSSLAKQDAALGDQHTRELAVRLQMQQGWQQIAEQLIADAVSEIISVDGDAGVLDATATPTPKFTVVSRDGREFIFTVNPKILKKMRLVKPGDKIVNITHVSATSRMDVQALWDYIVRSRNMWSATPPSKAEWYVVVRQANRGVSTGQYKLNPRAAAQIGRP
jgi:hypothetical protein